MCRVPVESLSIMSPLIYSLYLTRLLRKTGIDSHCQTFANKIPPSTSNKDRNKQDSPPNAVFSQRLLPMQQSQNTKPSLFTRIHIFTHILLTLQLPLPPLHNRTLTHSQTSNSFPSPPPPPPRLRHHLHPPPSPPLQPLLLHLHPPNQRAPPPNPPPIPIKNDGNGNNSDLHQPQQRARPTRIQPPIHRRPRQRQRPAKQAAHD
ncbi:MAG: hypothetical protein FRX48_04546 [Lasallia pustulata]|uniref:Uncharacterized protein n=1 Tax=Lasallia pustulata TaxID=136370 RepID=A0A5M8PNZ6_9LECA|nr:MAG: hypothetical protein FRX48_04546 [Lasallia pustulata]